MISRLFKIIFKDLTWYFSGALPAILVVIFSMIAVTYWEKYAIRSIGIFILFMIVTYIYIAVKYKK
ncbi:hypothetical protein CUN67_17515 [Pantoea cypripedii]|uniref:Uncharacterized protein n=1 Tax=Pantoea cypripedii TaxID=55209 RepID=A0A6B9G914_PANCY|nr:hypothetical protein CUN67_17515 [Pantoea cypripedii]